MTDSPYAQFVAALATAVQAALTPEPVPEQSPPLTLDQQRALVRGHMNDTTSLEHQKRYRALTSAAGAPQQPVLSLPEKRTRVRELMDGVGR
jgi:hypothetical protein